MSTAAKSPPDPLARLGSGTVLLIFGATWCLPSVLLSPIATRLRTERGADIREIDIDVWPQHAEQFRVISMPTVVKVVGKAEKKRLIGAVGRAELERLL